MSIKKDKEEEKIYEKEKARYDLITNNIKEKIASLEAIERNKLIEFESFIKTLQNAHKYYRNATYVQRRKIAKILILNIVVTARKQVQINFLPIFRPLFHKVQG